MSRQPDIDRLAQLLCTELHLPTPSLGLVVRAALADLRSNDLHSPHSRSALAAAIEDGLGYAGEGLPTMLNIEAISDWRGIVGRALDKALRRYNGWENQYA